MSMIYLIYLLLLSYYMQSRYCYSRYYIHANVINVVSVEHARQTTALLNYILNRIPNSLVFTSII